MTATQRELFADLSTSEVFLLTDILRDERNRMQSGPGLSEQRLKLLNGMLQQAAERRAEILEGWKDKDRSGGKLEEEE